MRIQRENTPPPGGSGRGGGGREVVRHLTRSDVHDGGGGDGGTRPASLPYPPIWAGIARDPARPILCSLAISPPPPKQPLTDQSPHTCPSGPSGGRGGGRSQEGRRAFGKSSTRTPTAKPMIRVVRLGTGCPICERIYYMHRTRERLPSPV